MIKAIELPAVNDRVGVVCGPGEFPEDHAGTVIDITEDRWGRFATVAMDDGTTKTCHGIHTVGIGWYKLEPVEVAYCVTDGCGQVATHIVSYFNNETDQLVQAVTVCKHCAPKFIMGHNDRVYARFAGIGA